MVLMAKMMGHKHVKLDSTVVLMDPRNFATMKWLY